MSKKSWFADYVREFVLHDPLVPNMPRAMPVDVQGKHLYANASIPLYLAIAAAKVTIIRTPMPTEMYSADLDPADVAAYAREPETFTVEKVVA